MLGAEAVRLAAVEVLCPTDTAISGGVMPTLAGTRVLDSRAASLRDIDPEKPYTPILALYTPESGRRLRGPLAAADDIDADAVLDIVAELAVSVKDEAGEFADAAAVAETDPDARLVLAALCAQVDMLLTRSQSGALWRRIVRRVVNVDITTFAVPEFGLRFHRVTMRYHLEIADDDFDMDDGGLPEPIRSVFEALPDQSYAKAKLAALAAHFRGDPLPRLEEISGHAGPAPIGVDIDQT